MDFWGWYLIPPGDNWPWLGLRLTNNGTSTIGSVNFKEKRESATRTGKAYHFYATYDGTYLKFTNSTFTTAVTNTFTDTRDSNKYNTVLIGNQIWMAENLKYLTSVVGTATGSRTVAYQYVYGYEGVDVAAAKATENYKTYGVLYNWLAALNGSLDSNANPSGVQGVCPAGWHLPSDAEWT